MRGRPGSLARAWVLGSAALLTGCLTPPVMRDAGQATVERRYFLASWPGVEDVSIEVEPGVTLRGIYVPAATGGPLVVHFLGSGASISTGAEFGSQLHVYVNPLERFARLGAASLAIDYRGIGPSSGEPNASAIPRDAWAIWQDALRRVDGDPKRLVLRGISLGTLAVASLIERGAEPAAVTLIAPVRAETLVHHWIASHSSSLAATLVAPLFRKPMEVDLFEAVARAPRESIVCVERAQGFLGRSERRRLEELVDQGDGRWVESDREHWRLVWRAVDGILTDEYEVLDAAFPGIELPDELLWRIHWRTTERSAKSLSDFGETGDGSSPVPPPRATSSP